MGWFWGEMPAAPAAKIAPHPIPLDASRSPPPECPMHQKSATALKPLARAESESACPYTPVHVSKTKDEAPPAKRSKYNPLNYMFSDLSQERAEEQKVALAIQREPSTIPKGSGDGNWEYPSPQQMYNALLRKGYHDTNPEDVTSMVSVHNFLNEGAWNEIRVHEGLFHKGLVDGWMKMEKGEAGIDPAVSDEADPKLMRFQGRPKDMTPKAAMWQVMGMIYPSKFKTNPPFDRHDWFVERKVGDTTKQIRYVIDYYDAPEDENGEPVFYLDVRPAVDTPTLAMERLLRYTGDFWARAAGRSQRVAGVEKNV